MFAALDSLLLGHSDLLVRVGLLKLGLCAASGSRKAGTLPCGLR